MTTRIGTWLGIALGVAVLATVGACGSSGGDGGTIPPTSEAIYTTGPITGFGSVHVNGVRYDTTGANIEIDGLKVAQSALKVGQVVQIRAQIQTQSESHNRYQFREATADTILYHHNVEGPVTSIDVAALKFVALGQTVIVGPDTSFGEEIVPSSIEGLAVDDVVQVSGLVNAAGEIEATRVDIRQNQGPYDVVGTVSGLDEATKTFFITGLKVDYSAANVEDFPSGSPADGDLVLVTGFDFDAAASLLVAVHVELRYDQAVQPGSGEKVHVEGLVTRFVSATDFDVAGQAVTTTASTVYEGGTAADLALDVHVCVEGVLDSNGVLVAERVRIRAESDVRIVSIVESIDTAQSQFTALGLTVTTDVSTRFEDQSALALANFGLADLHTGDWVEVRGYESPADSGQVMATRVERIDAQVTHEVRGPMINMDALAGDFDVLAVPVHTTEATHFVLEANEAEKQAGIPITAAEFFAYDSGTLVEARGAWSGTLLTADYAVIKTCDD